jgi:uncharacterized protein YndB with AHSA1/START domain
LWHALTDGDFNERYSAISSIGLESWLVLSLRQPGKLSVEGRVLRGSDRARRLAYTWNNRKEQAKCEGTSRMTFNLGPRGKVVKLTVTHDELGEDGKTSRDISGGRPIKIASLKSMLETGNPLPVDVLSQSKKELSCV